MKWFSVSFRRNKPRVFLGYNSRLRYHVALIINDSHRSHPRLMMSTKQATLFPTEKLRRQTQVEFSLTQAPSPARSMASPVPLPTRIAFIGNYLPRQCGIATFTIDLCTAVATEYGLRACLPFQSMIPIPPTNIRSVYGWKFPRRTWRSGTQRPKSVAGLGLGISDLTHPPFPGTWMQGESGVRHLCMTHGDLPLAPNALRQMRHPMTDQSCPSLSWQSCPVN
jgi:hypothetical protein